MTPLFCSNFSWSRKHPLHCDHILFLDNITIYRNLIISQPLQAYLFYPFIPKPSLYKTIKSPSKPKFLGNKSLPSSQLYLIYFSSLNTKFLGMKKSNAGAIKSCAGIEKWVAESFAYFFEEFWWISGN